MALLLEHRGRRPEIAPSAYVAPNAVICGDVTIGDDCRVLFGAVLTAEGGSIRLGARCIVMEHALIRGRAGHPTCIADHVLIGPHAHVNGARLGTEAFLATGAAVFPGAEVGARAEVRINAVVHVNSRLPEGATVPIGCVAAGDPAELFSPDRHEDLWQVQRDLDFPGTVFGIARDDLTMAAVARRYADLFGHHRQDREVT